MDLVHKRKRKEARRLFLTGEVTINAEIARRLGLKPHTVARYRKEEDWDGLRMKVDRRAAEKMVDQIANERVSLNVRHYKYYEVILNEVAATMKAQTGGGTERATSNPKRVRSPIVARIRPVAPGSRRGGRRAMNATNEATDQAIAIDRISLQ